MKTVLIVDDHDIFLESLSEALPAYADQFTVLTASNGAEAVQILGAHALDVVVTDLMMPEMDGFELLAYLTRYHPGLPAIVMTGYDAPRFEDRALSMNPIGFVKKPFEVSALADMIRSAIARPTRGHIQGFSLFSFLQLLEMERKTCSLRITSHAREGYMHFRGGELLDAECGDSAGDQSVYEMLCWEEAEIEIVDPPRRLTPRIRTSLAGLLMEGAYRKDEASRYRNGASPAGAVTMACVGAEEKYGLTSQPKEEEMPNLKVIQDALNEMRTELGDGFLATDVWKKDTALSIAAVNPQPKATALFNRVSDLLIKTLAGVEEIFPQKLQEYILRLEGDMYIYVLEINADYRWGMLVDGKKVSLGIMIGVSIPTALEKIRAAV